MKDTRLSYRPDIDGLRALAVTLVLLYHAFPELLPGGFIGVDVFFVISGFLITSLILKDLGQGTFKLSDFFFRRIRRLFPALGILLASVLMTGWFLLFRFEQVQLGKHVWSSALFIQNVILSWEVGYFDQLSEKKPLLHLWSLGIEEQIYLIWPFLLLHLQRWGQIRLASIFVLLALSLVACLMVSPASPVATFFLTPFRAWEFIAGALLCLMPRLESPRLRSGLATLGLGLVLVPSVVLTSHEVYPGWRALFPVLGGALIIHNAQGNHVGKLLSWKWLVMLGLVSYPIYLWHWPILSFAKIFFEGTLSVPIRMLLLGVSLFLAILTYLGLELPLRRRSLRPLAGVLLGLMLLLALFGISLHERGKFAVADEPPSYDRSYQWNETCLRKGDELFEGGFTSKSDFCHSGQDIQLSEILVIGDSHANRLYLGLRNLLPTKKIANLGRSACLPLPGMEFSGPRGTSYGCHPTMEKLFQFASESKSSEVVILSGYFSRYFQKRYPVSFSRDDFYQSFERGLAALTLNQKKVILVWDVPRIPAAFERCQGRPHRIPPPGTCDFPIEDHEREITYRKRMIDILARYPEVCTVDPAEVICPEGTCRVGSGNDLLYTDQSHLSLRGAEAVAKKIIKSMNQEACRRLPRSRAESSQEMTELR